MSSNPDPVGELIRRQAEIAAEIVTLTGCAPDVASMAAGSYLAFPSAPDFGFSPTSFGSEDARRRASKAYPALMAWVSAQARRVAA